MDYSAAMGVFVLLKFGGRFSRKADNASLASAVLTRSMNSWLTLDRLFELADRGLLEEPLARQQRAARFCRQLLRSCGSGREQITVGHHAGYEAQLRRPCGREGLSQQVQFRRPEMAHARRYRKA